jgi:hypothetical protein
LCTSYKRSIFIFPLVHRSHFLPLLLPSLVFQINYLTGLGLSMAEVENMVSLNKQILGATVDDLKSVVSYLEKSGLSNQKNLNEFLLANSYLLSYKPSSDATCLEKGLARAALTFGDRNGVKVAGVVQWREGASFGQSPVAPEAPKKL